MGMFDTIYNVPVKCPRCGDEEPKSVQIKCGPQLLMSYEFGKDRIEMNWTYEFYDSIIDEEKKIIRGMATCQKCKDESKEKMDELIEEAKKKGEIKIPDNGSKYLFECEIEGENALGVILQRLDDFYGDRNIELFDVAITLDNNNVAIFAEPIVDKKKRMD